MSGEYEKMNKKYNTVWFRGTLLLLDILLSWGVFYVCDMWLSSIFGPDIVEYENWFGTLDNTVSYRFGIGSVEIMLTLLQAALFLYIESALYKKKKTYKEYTCFAMVIHVLNFVVWVLFYIDWNSWIDIPNFLLPQYIVQWLMYNL